jgi:hypothetical protein
MLDDVSNNSFRIFNFQFSIFKFLHYEKDKNRSFGYKYAGVAIRNGTAAGVCGKRPLGGAGEH